MGIFDENGRAGGDGFGVDLIGANQLMTTPSQDNVLELAISAAFALFGMADATRFRLTLDTFSTEPCHTDFSTFSRSFLCFQSSPT